mmetsp:Transcript_2263/g.8364  ORF Transcript_2263/g.8364 Transcript_2263/m.8364 type:complete len:230 (+) Transcript_2263:544-1233(+)
MDRKDRKHVHNSGVLCHQYKRYWCRNHWKPRWHSWDYHRQCIEKKRMLRKSQGKQTKGFFGAWKKEGVVVRVILYFAVGKSGKQAVVAGWPQSSLPRWTINPVPEKDTKLSSCKFPNRFLTFTSRPLSDATIPSKNHKNQTDSETSPQSAITADFLGIPLWVPMLSNWSNTSDPSTSSPNTVCFPSNHSQGMKVRKNWLPFVFGPAFAHESWPLLVWRVLKFSSGKVLP